MGVNVNDLRRPWTVDDVIKEESLRVHYVNIKDFRFDQHGNVFVRRNASVRDEYPIFPPPNRWVAITLIQMNLCVIRRGVKWDLVLPIENPDDSWLKLDDSF